MPLGYRREELHSSISWAPFNSLRKDTLSGEVNSMMRCEICQQSEDDFDCHTEIDERLPVNYHPVITCTPCMRMLSQKLLMTGEFSAYQTTLDYCNALRDNYTIEIDAEDFTVANQRYCYALKLAGEKLISLIRELQ